MIKGFLFMLKRMGKKGQWFDPRFIKEHKDKTEEELRKEIIKALKSSGGGERQHNRLRRFKENLTGSSASHFENLRKDKDNYEKMARVLDGLIKEHGEKEKAEEAEERAAEAERRAAQAQEEAAKAEEELAEERGKIAERGGREPPVNKINIDLTKHVGSFGSAFFFVLLAFLVYFLDNWRRFGGIDIKVFLSSFGEASVWTIFFNLFVVTALVWYFLVNKPDKRDFISYAIFIFLTSLIISFGALKWGFYHIVMVYFLYFFFIKKTADDLGWDEAKTRYVMCVLLFIDYFGFGIINQYFGLVELENIGKVYIIGNRYIIPIWSYAILTLRQISNPHWFNALALVGLIVWTLAPIAQDIFITDAGKLATREQLEEAREHGETVRQKFFDNINAIFRGAVQRTQRQLEYATGGYYEGQVEENENIPLGVYFEDVKASVAEFYEDEAVEVWGNLLVRTLDRDTPVTVNIGCEYEEEHIPGTVRPEEGFTIYTMEEEVIECRFNEGTIPTGTRKIKLTADFNFKTMAYLKSYMMDKETLRSLRREGIDVLDYYGIKDKNPIAIFTNGPVKIGMETNAPPIGIDEQSTPYLGITIENQWNGNIKNIKDMIVQIPRGLEFFENCDQKFEEVTEEIIDPDYRVYKLNDRGRGYFKMPIKADEISYRSLRCLMQIKDKNRVLGDVPLTTKYFRTTVSYDYELVQEVRVNIKEVPRLDYYVVGGTCGIGNSYESILGNIRKSDLNECRDYLGTFNFYHSLIKNKDKIDLLMVLSVAQQESGCTPSNRGGIMQVDEDGRKKDYSGIRPIDVPSCVLFRWAEDKICCKVTKSVEGGGTKINYVELNSTKCEELGGEEVKPTDEEYTNCTTLFLLKDQRVCIECITDEECRVAAQIRDGVFLLDAAYQVAKEENSNKNYGINDLNLMKFALLGYNRGGSVMLEAMRYYYGGMTMYDAMKHGCEAFEDYYGKTDSAGYSLCTGGKKGRENIKAYGSAYPSAVFEIYKNACKDIGGAYNEESSS